MSFFKQKNSWGQIQISGTGKVFAYKDGELVRETPTKSKIVKYTFNLNGDCRKTEDRNGVEKWKRQDIVCVVWSDCPELTSIVKKLEIGDKFYIVGEKRVWYGLNPNTGKKKKNVEVELYEMKPLKDTNGRFTNLTDTESIDEEDEDYIGF